LIIDSIENASLYFPLNDRFAAAFRALESRQLLQAEAGRHVLQDTDLFALVQRYTTKPHSEGRWEAHLRYIDLQYIVSGTEVMGHAQLSSLALAEPYDEAKDIMFLTGDGNLFTLPAGSFAVFFPHDAHMPMLSPGSPTPVHKIVLKIRADALSLPAIPC
jgi:YhcH/YjgK/YiaL family protein